MLQDTRVLLCYRNKAVELVRILSIEHFRSFVYGHFSVIGHYTCARVLLDFSFYPFCYSTCYWTSRAVVNG